MKLTSKVLGITGGVIAIIIGIIITYIVLQSFGYITINGMKVAIRPIEVISRNQNILLVYSGVITIAGIISIIGSNIINKNIKLSGVLMLIASGLTILCIIHSFFVYLVEYLLSLKMKHQVLQDKNVCSIIRSYLLF